MPDKKTGDGRPHDQNEIEKFVDAVFIVVVVEE